MRDAFSGQAFDRASHQGNHPMTRHRGYGGDEFAIILPDTTLQAAEVAERLRVAANGAQA
jgi:hypothetical protein